MSYYILPKINNTIIVNPIESTNNDTIKPYISQSLFNYYNELNNKIVDICSNEKDELLNNYDNLIKIINPYEYIFSQVPGSKFSVSKLKQNSNMFYDLLEVLKTLNFFEIYKSTLIKTLHLTRNNNDTIECFELLRENYKDSITSYDEINDKTTQLICDEKFDFIFFEADTNNLNEYVISLIRILMIIIRNQIFGGSCIIKILHIFHKPIVDILYILSSLYDKTYILKPNSSSITSFDRYIVCKKCQNNDNRLNLLKYNYLKLDAFLKNKKNPNVISILDNEIPYYYTMKLDDMNIIVGQPQLESLDLIINILNNKNKDEKIENIKKNNIQKSVAWCEKYKIPYNKFIEKTNIFLPINKELNILETENIEMENIEMENIEMENVEIENVEIENDLNFI